MYWHEQCLISEITSRDVAVLIFAVLSSLHVLFFYECFDGLFYEANTGTESTTQLLYDLQHTQDFTQY